VYDNENIVSRIKEAYQEGFRDGFEYGSGKRSPYGCGTLEVEIADAHETAGRGANDGRP
jgi:hypothetical protein